MKFLKLLLLISFFPSVTLFAQPSLMKMKNGIDAEKSIQPAGIDMKLVNKTQAGILFSNTAITQAGAVNWLSTRLALRPSIDGIVEEPRQVQATGMQVKKYRQYYRGIKVEHGVINANSRNGKLALMQLEYYAIPDSLSTRPSLSGQQALDKAMAFVKGKVFAWTNYTGTDPEYKKPAGELVIIQTYEHEGELCLAYKFKLYSLIPLDKSWIYVNAQTGKIVLKNPIIKQHNYDQKQPHTTSASSNTNGITAQQKIPLPGKPLRTTDVDGMAATRFSGSQTISTFYDGSIGRPYYLIETRDGHNMFTDNYQRKPNNSDTNYADLAVNFTDNDNNWTAAEYHNANMDDAALDAHYNMEWVSDYWKDIHDRNGWDDQNSAFVSHVHVAENKYDDNGNFVKYNRWLKNAFWNGSSMNYGDGDSSITMEPLTALDVCAHEMGHAITETTSELVYQWESGAINEGFSDIWAACVTNYAKENDPSLTGENTWRLGEKTKETQSSRPGFRDMQDPLLFDDPSTYGSTNWLPGSYEDCKVTKTNDYCGVHNNSGVLNKWFYLITAGEQGINTKGTAYNIFGIGFGRSQELAYLMELNLTPNSSYTTARAVSLNIANTLYGYGSSPYIAIKDAWAAVGLDSSSFDKTNTPVFVTNVFKSIGVGKAGTILAGTTYSGLYRYKDDIWLKLPELTDVSVNDIKPDKFGNLWVAQSGRVGQVGGGGSIGGGVNHFEYPFDAFSTLYTVGDNPEVPSRNARCMYVDTFRLNDGLNSRVWMAGLAYFSSFNSTSGGLGQGLYNSVVRPFKPVSEGINLVPGTVGCLTVGGKKDQIWTFASANNGINQILTYNAETNALIRTYDHNTVTDIPTGFIARAIYGDRKKRMWIGTAQHGVYVFDEDLIWHFITPGLTSVLPAGTVVNFNAIAGNPYGDVYIGTDKGLLFFDHGIGEPQRLDDPQYYRLYTKENGLPSNNINAIAYDPTRLKLLIATDSGIVFWDPPCLGGSCEIERNTFNGYSESIGPGNWSNPAVWSTGVVPDSMTNVVINDTITVNIDAKCNSIAVEDEGSLKVNAGTDLKIFKTKPPIQENTGPTTGRRRRR